MDDRTADQPPIRPEQRRSSRFSVVVPVEVKWQEPSGKIVKQAAQAKEVNAQGGLDRKSTRLNSSHSQISYAVFCLKKKNNKISHSHCLNLKLTINATTPVHSYSFQPPLLLFSNPSFFYVCCRIARLVDLPLSGHLS